MKLKQYGIADYSRKRITERDEYGNADIIGMDMGNLLALDGPTLVMLTDALNKLAEYEDIRYAGQMALLPVPIGGKLYEPSVEYRRVIDWNVIGYRLTPTGIIYVCLDGDVEINSVQIGKDVFLTDKEAESELEKLEAKARLFD